MTLNRILLFIAFLSITQFANAQKDSSDYENEIEVISQQLHAQLMTDAIKSHLGKNNSYQVALVEIVNEDDKETKLTDLLERELAVDLSQKAGTTYTVHNRTYISQLMEEKNLPKTVGNKKDFAKNLGRIKAADLIVVGKLNNFEDQYKIIFTILETKEGTTVGGSKGKITASSFLKSKNEGESLNKKKETLETGIKKTKSKKIDKAVEIEDAIDEDSNCVSNNTGSITFTNKTKYKLQISIFKSSDTGSGLNIITVSSNEEYPMMEVLEGAYVYEATAFTPEGEASGFSTGVQYSGQVKVSKCKNTSIKIK